MLGLSLCCRAFTEASSSLDIDFLQVRVLRASPAVVKAMNQNLSNAVLAALSTLPSHFTDVQLFLAITGLSYKGDIRTWFAENPNKVKNIVEGNLDNFRELYSPILSACPLLHPVPGQPHEWAQVELSLFLYF